MDNIALGETGTRIHLIGQLSFCEKTGLYIEMENTQYPVIIHNFNREHLYQTVVAEGTWSENIIVVRKSPVVLVTDRIPTTPSSFENKSGKISTMIDRLVGHMKMQSNSEEGSKTVVPTSKEE